MNEAEIEAQTNLLMEEIGVLGAMRMFIDRCKSEGLTYEEAFEKHEKLIGDFPETIARRFFNQVWSENG